MEREEPGVAVTVRPAARQRQNGAIAYSMFSFHKVLGTAEGCSAHEAGFDLALQLSDAVVKNTITDCLDMEDIALLASTSRSARKFVQQCITETVKNYEPKGAAPLPRFTWVMNKGLVSPASWSYTELWQSSLDKTPTQPFVLYDQIVRRKKFLQFDQIAGDAQWSRTSTTGDSTCPSPSSARWRGEGIPRSSGRGGRYILEGSVNYPVHDLPYGAGAHLSATSRISNSYNLDHQGRQRCRRASIDWGDGRDDGHVERVAGYADGAPENPGASDRVIRTKGLSPQGDAADAETSVSKSQIEVRYGPTLSAGLGASMRILNTGIHRIKLTMQGNHRHWGIKFGIARPMPYHMESLFPVVGGGGFHRWTPSHRDQRSLYPAHWKGRNTTNVVLWCDYLGEVTSYKGSIGHETITLDTRHIFDTDRVAYLELNMSHDEGGALNLIDENNNIMEVLSEGLTGEFVWIGRLVCGHPALKGGRVSMKIEDK